LKERVFAAKRNLFSTVENHHKKFVMFCKMMQWHGGTSAQRLGGKTVLSAYLPIVQITLPK
jgi:hypothetical protein